MDEDGDHKLLIVVGAIIFLFSLISGSYMGYVGLQTRHEQLTTFSSIIYPLGIAAFIACLVYPFKSNRFWFSYLLERLGRIGWLRKFEIGQHAEGAINLSLVWSSWGIFLQLIVGNGSYVLNDLSTIIFMLFVNSWIFISMHVHFENLVRLSNLSKLVISNQKKRDFGKRIENTTQLFKKISLIFFISGVLAYTSVATFWVEPQDNIPGRCTFYTETIWERGPRFGMPYPLTLITWLHGKLGTGIFFGIVSVIGGMIITTTILLLWLDSERVQIELDIFDPNCLRPAEKLLNSLWLLTGAGLLMVPYMTALSISAQEFGLIAISRGENYLSWGYVIFFVGLFSFSIVKFFSFVSRTKNPIEQQLRAELKNALERVDKEKLNAISTKLRLLHRFRGRPTLATALQLAHIIAIILLNILIKFLE